MTTLRTLQAGFQQAILNNCATPELFVDESVAGRGGVALYLMAYRARLAAALRDNYPVLHRALGDERFDALARCYIEEQPSTFRSIRWFGGSLADFMAGNPDLLPHPALVDLARMDWALRGAFDAADSELLSLADLAQFSPEAWLSCRFSLIPSAALLDLKWNVAPIWRALSGNENAQTDAPQALANTLVVWRPHLDCLWRSASAIETAGLNSLLAGATFSEYCETIVRCDVTDPAHVAAGLLQSWVAEGMLGKRVGQGF